MFARATSALALAHSMLHYHPPPLPLRHPPVVPRACLAVLALLYFAAASLKDFEMDTNALPAKMETWLMIPCVISTKFYQR